MDTGGRAKSEINVTPLIDIVLVLLIVFIVMVPSLSKVLPVAVPQVVRCPGSTGPRLGDSSRGGLVAQGRSRLSAICSRAHPWSWPSSPLDWYRCWNARFRAHGESS